MFGGCLSALVPKRSLHTKCRVTEKQRCRQGITTVLFGLVVLLNKLNKEITSICVE